MERALCLCLSLLFLFIHRINCLVVKDGQDIIPEYPHTLHLPHTIESPTDCKSLNRFMKSSMTFADVDVLDAPNGRRTTGNLGPAMFLSHTLT